MSTATSNTDLAPLKEKDMEPRNLDSDLPPHDLEKAATAQSTHPLEQLEPARKYTGFRWFLVCFALYSAAFLYGLDNTIVADIQAAAVETFGEVEKLGWLGIGFPLGSVATILSIGKAFGIFDVKYLFVGSLIMFEAGSALCGGSPSMNALIVGRVWAGAGGAGMYLGVLNILSLNTTIQERPIYMSLCGFVWGIGCILGPVIGGSFADSGATWRWAFYINLVIFAICSPVYFFVMDSYEPQPETSFGQKMKHIDWAGVVLNAALYTSFVLVFTFGGATWAWDDGRIISLFVVFGVVLIAFAVQQTFCIFTTPERRLFPVDFLRHKSLVLLYVATSAGCTALFVSIYYIPLYFSFVHNDTNVEAAVRLLPFICVTIFFIMLNGGLMPKFGYYMPWYFLSGVFLLIGGSLMYTVDVDTSNAAIYGYSVLTAIGAGASQQAAYSIAQAKVSVNRIADAIGFINTAQIGSIVIALTITGTVFQSLGFRHVSAALEGLDFSPAQIHAALAGAKSDVFTTVSPAVREKVVEGIVKAISDAYILVIVAGAVTLVSSLLMKREKLFIEMTAGG
jgi:MFS family permease